jgi:hypothetical protein
LFELIKLLTVDIPNEISLQAILKKKKSSFVFFFVGEIHILITRADRMKRKREREREREKKNEKKSDREREKNYL